MHLFFILVFVSRLVFCWISCLDPRLLFYSRVCLVSCFFFMILVLDSSLVFFVVLVLGSCLAFFLLSLVFASLAPRLVFLALVIDSLLLFCDSRVWLTYWVFYSCVWLAFSIVFLTLVFGSRFTFLLLSLVFDSRLDCLTFMLGSRLDFFGSRVLLPHNLGNCFYFYSCSVIILEWLVARTNAQVPSTLLTDLVDKL